MTKATDRILFGVSKLKKKATQARLSLHLSKCHSVATHLSSLGKPRDEQ